MFWCKVQYVIHSFIDEPLNIHGGNLSQNEQALHGHQIALHTHDPLVALPPVGVFNWHYLQCVLKKFSTPAYQAIDNICYFSLPFRNIEETTTMTMTMTETSQNHVIATWSSVVSVN